MTVNTTVSPRVAYYSGNLRTEAEVRAARPKPLPCPWCGSAADAGRIGFTNKFGVICDNDDCPVEAQATADTLDEAIRLWNRRAPK